MARIRSIHAACLCIVATIIVLTQLMSCSIGPRTRFIQKSPNFNDAMGKITRLGIISDATIVTSSDADDQNSKVYVSIEDSKAVESHILTNAARYMKQKGYEVAFQQAPFVGSIYYSKNTSGKFNVSQQRGTHITTAYPPFNINESVLDDESYKNALLVLTSSVYQSIKKGATAKSVPSEFFLTGTDIDESLKIVAERTEVG